MILKIYLKNKHLPVAFEIRGAKDFDAFYSELQTHDIVKFGQVIFRRDDFIRATLEIEK